MIFFFYLTIEYLNNHSDFLRGELQITTIYKKLPTEIELCKISFTTRQIYDGGFWQRSCRRLRITVVNHGDDSRTAIISHGNIPASWNVRLWHSFLTLLIRFLPQRRSQRNRPHSENRFSLISRWPLITYLLFLVNYVRRNSSAQLFHFK